jgi:hypothetical protein
MQRINAVEIIRAGSVLIPAERFDGGRYPVHDQPGRMKMEARSSELAVIDVIVELME